MISVIKYAFQRKKILFSFELECVHTHGACIGQKNHCSDTTCFIEIRSLTAPGVRLATSEHIHGFLHGFLHGCGGFRLRSSYWYHKCCYPQSYFQSSLFMLIFLKGSKMLAFRNWKLLEVVLVMSWWAYFCQSVLKWTHHIQISFLGAEEIFNLVYLHHYRSVFRLFICKCTIWGTIKCWQSRLQSYQLQCIFHNFSHWHLWW